MKLFYLKETTNSILVGYANARYKSDPHEARLQIDYLFCYNSTTISWFSIKQMPLAISVNHFKIIVLYEVGRYCIWLRSVISHIQGLVIRHRLLILLLWFFRIMLFVLHKLEEDMLREIRPNISYQIFSILMTFKKVDKLMLNKYVLLRIL